MKKTKKVIFMKHRVHIRRKPRGIKQVKNEQHSKDCDFVKFGIYDNCV